MQAQCRVHESRSLTATTHWIRVERPPGFRFDAGQHVMLQLTTPGGADDRFLSIASGPDDGYLDFAVRLSESDFKRAFRRLEPGDPVTVIGPSGRFRRDPRRAAVLLSGGIGITPLRSMLRDAAGRADLPPTVLVYGNRSPADIPFRCELESLGQGRGLRVVHVVDQPDATWTGAVGHIDQALVEASIAGLDSPLFFVCGPPGMVTAMTELLGAMDVGEDDVRREDFTGY